MGNSKQACQRKIKYTKHAAKRQLAIRRADKGTKGCFYHCEHCNMYHISSQPTNFIPGAVWDKVKRGII